MRYIKTFSEFINESVSQSGISSTMKSTEKLVTSLGYEYSIYNGSIKVVLPDDIKKSGPNELKLIKGIKKLDKEHVVLTIKLIMGYRSGNTIIIQFPFKPKKVTTLYHVAERENIDSIMKNGLKPSFAHEHSATFGVGLSGGNKTIQLYKATFGVTGTKQARQLKTFFPFKEPVILKIKSKGTIFYDDPLMPGEYKSVLTFEYIDNNIIEEIEEDNI